MIHKVRKENVKKKTLKNFETNKKVDEKEEKEKKKL